MATRKSGAKKPAAKRANAKKTTTRKSPTRKAATSRAGGVKRAKREPNAAFMVPMQPSEELAAVIGAKPRPRTEVTKRIWEYIKKNGLQDEKNRRQINADDRLRAVFGGKRQVSMFEMTRLVNDHLENT
jgi:upstream activation factor subunit UAF30